METIDAFASAYPLNVLIADDDATRRAMTKQQLIQLGYKPDEAATDSEVLHMAGAQQYDVILMDVHIPGLEEILDIRRPETTTRPIFIAVSSAAASTFMDVSLRTRLDSVITRPMDRQELLLQLKACSLLAGRCRIKAHRQTGSASDRYRTSRTE
jgi:CheY-like chemotaxis protein